MKRLVLTAALLLPLTFAHAGDPTPQQYCQKFKEQGAERGSVAITIEGQACTMKTPAKQLCRGGGFAPTGGIIPIAPNYVCYKVKCPKATNSATVTDQFGSHTGTTKAPNVACFQVFDPV